VEVDWGGVFGGGRVVELPTYAFQHKRYWLEATKPKPVDAIDAAFWDVVERQDLAVLQEEIGVGGQQPLSEALPLLSQWHRRRRSESSVDSWRYEVIWKPVTGVSNATTRLSGTWLLIAPADGGIERQYVAEALSATDADVIDLAVDTTADLDRTALSRRIAAAATEVGPLAGVLCLLAVDERPHPEHDVVPAGVAASLVTMQALVDAGVDAPQWLLTRGAVNTGESDDAVGAAQAQVWGLGRVMALEHPQCWGGLIDLPPTLDEDARGWLPAALAGDTGEDQIAVRRHGIWARRLVRAPRHDAPTAKRRSWTPRGTVLITGGTGALGAHVGRWAAAQGAAHVVLVSRAGRDATGAAELEAELIGLGAHVTITACDVTDRRALADVLDAVNSEELPVTAVVHTAGAVDFTPVRETTVEQFAHVVAAKVAGAVHLHELTRSLTLDAFVLFSSGAGVWGSSGNGAYAAGNAFLDGLAQYRRAVGLPATSIAWGSWGGGGMTAGEAEQVLAGQGIRAMAPEAALIALARAAASPEPLATVADLDWQRFAPVFTLSRPSPLIADIAEAREALRAAEDANQDDGSTLRDRLTTLTAADQTRLIQELVCDHVAVVLGHDTSHAVEPERAFQDVGFTSLTAVELRNRLVRATGLKLPTTLVFDHPTPAVLAKFLLTELIPDAAQNSVENSEEAMIRQRLSSIPLTRLREAGLLRTLLDLAEPTAGRASSADRSDLIKAMDVDDLVRMALERSDSE
jgi:NAD(P)-dependent dehydrogenase (short-subunit alcohol dehydrogenase family)